MSLFCRKVVLIFLETFVVVGDDVVAGRLVKIDKSVSVFRSIAVEGGMFVDIVDAVLGIVFVVVDIVVG